MITIKHASHWKQEMAELKSRGASIGFVPTMGALHAGHESLLDRARKDHDVLAVSIFINPTQFNDPEDLKQYPKTFEEDIAVLERSGADYLFFPDAGELYPDGYRYSVNENSLSSQLCGAGRPGHFTGVLTVVLKLLQLTGADSAYFGEKDYQQYLLVRDMAEAFFIDTEIVPCPLIREPSGLAMSSRNRLLTGQEYHIAPRLYEILCSSDSEQDAVQQLEREGFEVEYVQQLHGRRLAAVRLGHVRLIDNVIL
jgi:pantoate--beta-alanine ligase